MKIFRRGEKMLITIPSNVNKWKEKMFSLKN